VRGIKITLKSQLNRVLKDMILCIAAWAAEAVQTIRRARCCRAGAFQGKNAKDVSKSACFGAKIQGEVWLVPKTDVFGAHCQLCNSKFRTFAKLFYFQYSKSKERTMKMKLLKKIGFLMLISWYIGKYYSGGIL